MDFATIAFYIFAAMAACAALAVISVKNPVHAVLSLILTFFSVSCVWILAGAEFLGVTLILVYVGAVMVLLLFVVMMLDVDTVPLREGFVRYMPVGMAVAFIMLAEMLVLVGVKSKAATGFPALSPEADASNVKWLAYRLFTDFLLPFETAAVILTIAVIAAVMLTLRRRHGARHQDPAHQSRVKSRDRLRMVKVESATARPLNEPVVEEPAATTEGGQP